MILLYPIAASSSYPLLSVSKILIFGLCSLIFIPVVVVLNVIYLAGQEVAILICLLQWFGLARMEIEKSRMSKENVKTQVRVDDNSFSWLYYSQFVYCNIPWYWSCSWLLSCGSPYYLIIIPIVPVLVIFLDFTSFSTMIRPSHKMNNYFQSNPSSIYLTEPSIAIISRRYQIFQWSSVLFWLCLL